MGEVEFAVALAAIAWALLVYFLFIHRYVMGAVRWWQSSGTQDVDEEAGDYEPPMGWEQRGNPQDDDDDDWYIR